jgi:hypothetical protein
VAEMWCSGNHVAKEACQVATVRAAYAHVSKCLST